MVLVAYDLAGTLSPLCMRMKQRRRLLKVTFDLPLESSLFCLSCGANMIRWFLPFFFILPIVQQLDPGGAFCLTLPWLSAERGENALDHIWTYPCMGLERRVVSPIPWCAGGHCGFALDVAGKMVLAIFTPWSEAFCRVFITAARGM